MSDKLTLTVGSKIESKKYGEGVILQLRKVEMPSDGDHTMFVCRMKNGKTRHFKAASFK